MSRDTYLVLLHPVEEELRRRLLGELNIPHIANICDMSHLALTVGWWGEDETLLALIELYGKEFPLPEAEEAIRSAAERYEHSPDADEDEVEQMCERIRHLNATVPEAESCWVRLLFSY